MDNKVKNVLQFLNEKYGEELNKNYSNEKVKEIVINCVSLVETFNPIINRLKNPSLSINLYDGEEITEKLHGITANTLAQSIADILLMKSDKFTKLDIISYSYTNGEKIVNEVGSIDIS